MKDMMKLCLPIQKQNILSNLLEQNTKKFLNTEKQSRKTQRWNSLPADSHFSQNQFLYSSRSLEVFVK